MRRILIVYGATNGQTLKIAMFIAGMLRIQGWSVELDPTPNYATDFELSRKRFVR